VQEDRACERQLAVLLVLHPELHLRCKKEGDEEGKGKATLYSVVAQELSKLQQAYERLCNDQEG